MYVVDYFHEFIQITVVSVGQWLLVFFVWVQMP